MRRTTHKMTTGRATRQVLRLQSPPSLSSRHSRATAGFKPHLAHWSRTPVRSLNPSRRRLLLLGLDHVVLVLLATRGPCFA